jgi:hypothetical protein
MATIPSKMHFNPLRPRQWFNPMATMWSPLRTPQPFSPLRDPAADAAEPTITPGEPVLFRFPNRP